MPTYDYRCTLCGREVEVSHAIGTPGPASCSACGGPMKKALSAPAIHFKGSGWAKKDARSAAAPTTKDGGEGKPSGGAETSDAGAEGGSVPTAPASSADTAVAKDSTAATSGKKAGSSAKAG